jgi:rod shape-determining protein MreB
VEVREALSASTQVIIDTIKDALDEVPPEIVADLMDSGICLAGGGSLLQGLAERLSDELNLRVWVAEDPMTCVVRGAGMVLEDFPALSRYLVGLERGSTRHS